MAARAKSELLHSMPCGFATRLALKSLGTIMRVDQLKQLLRNQPFEPFTVHLPEGRGVKVWHHDFAMVSPDGRTLVAFDRDGIADLIDVMLIASIHMENSDTASEKKIEQALTN